MHNQKRGFTLMELLIAIAIVAILAAIAVPTYLSYTRQAYITEIVQKLDSYKTIVGSCVLLEHGTLENCDGGTHGIPANFSDGEGLIFSVNVIDSVIYIVPNSVHGLSSENVYLATPIYTEGQDSLRWEIGGNEGAF